MIAARGTHDHYLAHRSFSISGRRLEGALARIIRRESGAALPGMAASPRYRKAWGQFGQAVVAIGNDDAFTCGYAVVFFVGHAVVHVPFYQIDPNRASSKRLAIKLSPDYDLDSLTEVKR
jgi:hypothetical protein